MPKIISIQRRKNKEGKIKFRAIVVFNDIVVDGWGDSPGEAEEVLKLKMVNLLLHLKKLQNENNQT